MSEAFLGEIRILPFNFAPWGWARCDGAVLPISQNTALFTLLGTYYGGDGRTTFALPDLQGRVPLGSGYGPGLTPRTLGGVGGAASVTLTQAEVPAHSHAAMGTSAVGTQADPTNATWAVPGAARGEQMYAPALGGAGQAMGASAIGPVGGGQSHDNMAPYLTLTFVIALEGIYPSRS